MLATSLPIARLRALGYKVSTVIGHWPEAGIFHYSVTPPEGVGPQEFTDIEQDSLAGVRTTISVDRERVIYYREVRDDPKLAERRMAERLASAAGYAEARAEAMR